MRAAAAPLGCSFCVLCLLAGYVPTDDKTLNTGSLARSVDLNHPLPPASSPSPCALIHPYPMPPKTSPARRRLIQWPNLWPPVNRLEHGTLAARLALRPPSIPDPGRLAMPGKP